MKLVKLISLNLEGAKHLSRALPFLEEENADVVCLQELFEKDGTAVAKHLGMSFMFAPMALKKYNADDLSAYETLGIGILSKEAMRNMQLQNYWSPSEDIIKFDTADIHTKRATQRHTLLSAEITFEEKCYTIATTHFTWTPNGLPDAYQKKDAETLLTLLSPFERLVFCGDLNIPRNYNVLYKKFAAHFTDAIPDSYVTSLDLKLHRVRVNPVESEKLSKFMVDYLFLKGYKAKDVRLQSGVSDHMAIVATINSI